MKNSEHRELSCRSLKQWRRFLSCRTWKGISQNPHTSERRLGKGDSHYHRASSSLRCLYIAIDYIHLYPIKRSGEDQLVLCNLSASRLQFVGSSVSWATRNALGVSHQAVLMPCVWRDFPVAEGKIRTQRHNRLVRTQWWLLTEVRQKIGAVKL